MLMQLELPLLGYALAPDWTPRRRGPTQASVGRKRTLGHSHRAHELGGALVIKGIIGLVS